LSGSTHRLMLSRVHMRTRRSRSWPISAGSVGCRFGFPADLRNTRAPGQTRRKCVEDDVRVLGEYLTICTADRPARAAIGCFSDCRCRGVNVP
jgi:hypothetical protein